jgi:hypothetical protein
MKIMPRLESRDDRGEGQTHQRLAMSDGLGAVPAM